MKIIQARIKVVGVIVFICKYFRVCLGVLMKLLVKSEEITQAGIKVFGD